MADQASKYEKWLADILGTDRRKVSELFKSKLALTFLITWSVFESKCFDGYLRVTDFEKHARVKAQKDEIAVCIDSEDVAYFHARYQDKNKRCNLLHGQNLAAFDAILTKSFPELDTFEKWYLSLVVVNRYRNNMFHGNKAVANWLQFDVEIEKCIRLMQSWIDCRAREPDA